MKKNLLKLTMAAAMLLGFVFSGCAGNASDDSDGGSSSAAKNLEVTSDYSQITVTWEGKPKKDSGFYIFASQENDTSKFTVDNAKDAYNVKNTSSFTVDKSGHYYVWVRNGYDGPFSDPAEVDVKLLEAAKNVTASAAILGANISWTNPDGITDEDIGFNFIGYKKEGETEWHYSQKSYFKNDKRNIMTLDDGIYTFKVVLADKYETEVYSEESAPFKVVFDSNTYGNAPENLSSMKNAANAVNIAESFNAGEKTAFYYLQCNKGDRYQFEVWDRNSYSADRLGSGLNYSDLTNVSVYIYISGACQTSGDNYKLCKPEGEIVSKSIFYPKGYYIDFEAPHDGYYIVQIRRSEDKGTAKYGFSVASKRLASN